MEIQTRIAFDQINLASHSKSFSFRSSEQEDPGPESDPTRRSIRFTNMDQIDIT